MSYPRSAESARVSACIYGDGRGFTIFIYPASSCRRPTLDPRRTGARWEHGNAVTLSGQRERRRDACNRRRHHLTPLRLTLLFSSSEPGPFSRLFLRDRFSYLSAAKWAKKRLRFPKSLWVRTDADHSQPCVHTGTISACMRSGARPSLTNPIKPIHCCLWQGHGLNAASPVTVKKISPKGFHGQFGLLFILQQIYLIS